MYRFGLILAQYSSSCFCNFCYACAIKVLNDIATIVKNDAKSDTISPIFEFPFSSSSTYL